MDLCYSTGSSQIFNFLGRVARMPEMPVHKSTFHLFLLVTLRSTRGALLIDLTSNWKPLIWWLVLYSEPFHALLSQDTFMHNCKYHCQQKFFFLLLKKIFAGLQRDQIRKKPKCEQMTGLISDTNCNKFVLSHIHEMYNKPPSILLAWCPFCSVLTSDKLLSHCERQKNPSILNIDYVYHSPSVFLYCCISSSGCPRFSEPYLQNFSLKATAY